MTALARRHLLLGGAALALGAGLPLQRVSLAALPGERRLLVVLLRGGLDGLAAVPAPGDPAFRGHRPDAATGLDLDGTLALHPALDPLRPLWDAGSLAVVPAVGLAVHTRSHFEAQDLLEGGGSRPRELHTGWLNRLASALQAEPLVAVGQSTPLAAQGPHPVTLLAPQAPPEADEDLVQAVRRLYAADPLLGPALDRALEDRPLVEAAGSPGRRRDPTAALAPVVRLLAEGPTRLAFVDVGGWDTHQRQDTALTDRLGALASGLAGLPALFGPAWSHAVVVVVSEFGRTVSLNGTGGTDHGSGGVAFAMGAVRGGVHGQWPGLGPRELLDGRDLRPTTELRTVWRGVLGGHLGVPEHTLDALFPGSHGSLPGLM